MGRVSICIYTPKYQAVKMQRGHRKVEMTQRAISEKEGSQAMNNELFTTMWFERLPGERKWSDVMHSPNSFLYPNKMMCLWCDKTALFTVCVWIWPIKTSFSRRKPDIMSLCWDLTLHPLYSCGLTALDCHLYRSLQNEDFFNSLETCKIFLGAFFL